MTTTYSIDDAYGTQLTTGIQSEAQARELAQQMATERGEVVSLYASDSTDGETIAPTQTTSYPADVASVVAARRPDLAAHDAIAPVYHAYQVPADAPARKQRGPYTLADATLRAEHLLRAGVTTAAVRDDRAMGAPDDRDGSERGIKACYVTYEHPEAAAAAGVFALKPWS
jgi:hypothetical protein